MAVDEMHALTRENVARKRGRHLLGRLILIVFAAALAVAAVRVSSLAPLRTTAGPGGWRIFHEPKNDWTLQYPESWHAQRIKETKKGSPYTSMQYGILISNIDRRFEHTKDPSIVWTPWFDLRGVPDRFVGVQVSWMYGGGFVVTCDQWGSRLPLSLEDAEPMEPLIEVNAHLEGRSLHFVARHEALYYVRAWTGPTASASDLAKLDRIVSSITFDNAPKTSTPLSRLCLG